MRLPSGLDLGRGSSDFRGLPHVFVPNDPTQPTHARRYQPEEHDEDGLLRGKRALGLEPSPELPVDAFDDVRGP